jgi:hypothetical protein
MRTRKHRRSVSNVLSYKKGGKRSIRSKRSKRSKRSVKSKTIDHSTIISKFLRTFNENYKSESILIKLYNVFEGMLATDAMQILNKLKEDLLSKYSAKSYSFSPKFQSITGGFPPQGLTPEQYEKYVKDSYSSSELQELYYNLLLLWSIGFIYAMFKSLIELIGDHGNQIRIKRFFAKMNRIRITSEEDVKKILSQRPPNENTAITLENYRNTVFARAPIDIEVGEVKQDPITIEDINNNDLVVAIYQNGFYFLFEMESFDSFLVNFAPPYTNPTTNLPIMLNQVFICRVHYPE